MNNQAATHSFIQRMLIGCTLWQTPSDAGKMAEKQPTGHILVWTDTCRKFLKEWQVMINTMKEKKKVR